MHAAWRVSAFSGAAAPLGCVTLVQIHQYYELYALGVGLLTISRILVNIAFCTMTIHLLFTYTEHRSSWSTLLCTIPAPKFISGS